MRRAGPALGETSRCQWGLAKACATKVTAGWRPVGGIPGWRVAGGAPRSSGMGLVIIGELQGTRPAAQDWRKAGCALGPAPPRCCLMGRVDPARKRWRGDGVRVDIPGPLRQFSCQPEGEAGGGRMTRPLWCEKVSPGVAETKPNWGKIFVWRGGVYRRSP
jgi:hypothetical protein